MEILFLLYLKLGNVETVYQENVYSVQQANF